MDSINEAFGNMANEVVEIAKALEGLKDLTNLAADGKKCKQANCVKATDCYKLIYESAAPAK